MQYSLSCILVFFVELSYCSLILPKIANNTFVLYHTISKMYISSKNNKKSGYSLVQDLAFIAKSVKQCNGLMPVTESRRLNYHKSGSNRHIPYEICPLQNQTRAFPSFGSSYVAAFPQRHYSPSSALYCYPTACALLRSFFRCPAYHLYVTDAPASDMETTGSLQLVQCYTITHMLPSVL